MLAKVNKEFDLHIDLRTTLEFVAGFQEWGSYCVGSTYHTREKHCTCVRV